VVAEFVTESKSKLILPEKLPLNPEFILSTDPLTEHKELELSPEVTLQVVLAKLATPISLGKVILIYEVDFTL
jgi:hypothetical protein